MANAAALQDVILYFSDYSRCRRFMISVRWPGGEVTCPVCASDKLCYLAKHRTWKCYAAHPKSRFTLKSGTIFEDSPLPLEKWLPAAWVLLTGNLDVSSWELHRALGVTQKTAWLMLHRITLAIRSKAFRRRLRAQCGESDPPHTAASAFENTSEFQQLTAGMRRLLRLPKAELDEMVREAKLASPRFGDPLAPGRRQIVSRRNRGPARKPFRPFPEPQ
jgi:transposase-like protein